MPQNHLRFPLLAVLLLASACSRGVLHTGAAGATVAPPIPVPVRGTAVATCDAGLDCSGPGTVPGEICDPGLVACPGSGTGYCFDLQASPEHCGTCGHACALGSPCDNGQCRVVHCTSQMSVRSLRLGQSTAIYNQAVLLDCNRDGALDMIAPSPVSLYTETESPFDVQESVSVYRGNSDGTFVLGERYPAQVGQAGYGFFRILVADLNRDQIPDLIMPGPPTRTTQDDTQITVVVRLGKGDCTFGPEIGLAAGVRPSSFALADLDGDSILDLAVTSEEGKHLRTFHGHGDGSFSDRQELTVGGTTTAVLVTDWNSDGIPDLVATDDYLHLLLGTGQGRFAPAIDCAISVVENKRTRRGAPVIADFDQDGVVDLAAGHDIWLGMYECSPTRTASFPDAYFDSSPLLAGDFNGDGALDLAVGAPQGIGFMPGDGRGSFGKIVIVGDYDPQGAADIYAENHDVFAGDFNGDGRLDLAVSSGITRIFINTCQ